MQRSKFVLGDYVRVTRMPEEPDGISTEECTAFIGHVGVVVDTQGGTTLRFPHHNPLTDHATAAFTFDDPSTLELVSRPAAPILRTTFEECGAELPDDNGDE